MVRGGLVYDPSASEPPRRADIWVRDGQIHQVIPHDSPRPRSLAANVTILDASGQLVLPGFVNAHYHSHDTLLKGRFETGPLEWWMIRALPSRYGPRSDHELYVRTLLGALECLKLGITTVQDMLSLSPMTVHGFDTIVRAYRDAGIRVVLAPQLADVPMVDAVPRWNEVIPERLQPMLQSTPTSAADDVIPPNKLPAYITDLAADQDADDRIAWGLAASGPERCSPALVRTLVHAAREARLPFFAHVAISRAEWVLAQKQFGGSAVRHLNDLGALGPETTLAHCVWITEEDVELLAETGTHVVANPVSNLKVKNGVAPLLSMYRSGVPVGLGCDNSSCGDGQNMFGVMKSYALLAGMQSTVAATPSARDALAAATSGGAAAVGMADRCGALDPGAYADLVTLDLTDETYLPLNDVARQVVFSESGRSVRSVVVAGRVVVKDGSSTVFTVDEVDDLLEDVMPTFRADVERVLTETSQLEPYIMEAERQFWAPDAP